MNQSENGKRVWTQIVLLGALILAISAALWYWREPLFEFFNNQERVRVWIRGFGSWAPMVSIGLNAAQVLIAPLPGQIVGIANGYLYGLWLGTLYSMIGLVVGRTLAMLLGRWFGRPLVQRLVKPERLAKWDGIAQRRGALFFFLVFLLPFLPDDIVCFLVGFSPLPILRMGVLSALGGLPGVFVSCWVGATASELPWWAWIPLISGAAVLGWAFWRYEARLEEAMVGLAERLAPGRTPEEDDEGQSDTE